MRVLNSFVIILFIGVCLHSTAQEKVFDDVERLVVTINGNFLEWGEKTGTFGAGIIFGYRNDDIYIVTCNHVVREKPSNKIATDILIKLKDYPGDSLEAIVTDHFDAELDIAVLKLEMNQISFDFCTLPLDNLGESETLVQGDNVYPLGSPPGKRGFYPEFPDEVVTLDDNIITFPSGVVEAGYSGGALLNNDGDIIGVIQTLDRQSFSEAIRIERVIERLKIWNYPVQIRKYSHLTATPLHEAVINNDLDKTRNLLQNCANVNAINSDYESPLLLACQNSYFEIAKLLVNYGADINFKGYNSRTPFHLACMNGPPELVEFLIQNDADINLRDSNRHSALYFASKYNQTLIVETLLTAEIVIDNKWDLRPDSPLNIAASEGFYDICRILIGAGLSLESGKQYYRTPIIDASINGHLDVVSLLLNSGANINFVQPGGQGNKESYVLACIVNYNPKDEHDYQKKVEILETLLQKGASPITLSYSQCSNNMHEVIKRGELEIMESLLKAFSNNQLIDQEEESRRLSSYLIIAAELGNLKMVNFFLNHGANPNLICARNFDLIHPLFYAIKNDDILLAKMLLKTPNKCEEMLIDSAMYYRNLEIIELFIRSGLDFNFYAWPGWKTPLYNALLNNDIELMKVLLEGGVDVNMGISNDPNKSPLFKAVQNNNLKAVKILLQYGAAVIYNPDENYSYVSPLEVSLRNENIEIIKLILNKKPDIDYEMGSYTLGQKAFAIVIQNKNHELIELLLEKDFNIHYYLPDSKKTALYISVENNDVEFAAYLLSKGADPELIGRARGYSYLNPTSYEKAVELDNEEMIKLLTRYRKTEKSKK